MVALQALAVSANHCARMSTALASECHCCVYVEIEMSTLYSTEPRKIVSMQTTDHDDDW